jgi:TRAP transporter TAXI family solute receptor
MSNRFATAFLEFIKVYGLLALIVAAGFAVAYQYVGAPPPAAVRIATGPESGAYHAFARQYARLLADDGIALEIVPTAGSVENLELLRRGDVSLALVQGGSAGDEDRKELESLGSLFLEPVWVFTRKQKTIKRLSELKGRRVAVGRPGSGTHLLAMRLLAANGVTKANATVIEENAAEMAPSLQRGGIDAAFYVASPEAPLVRTLLQNPVIEILSYDRAPAYGRLFSFLTPATLSEGVVSLERDIPSRDIVLVAAAANLAARKDLNASLIPALMNAVTRIHQVPEILTHTRRFPSVDFFELPLNKEARHYITNGPSFLFRWLPYGTAAPLDRLKILLLPFLALLLPLFRIAPPLYTWQVRRKIFRWYAAVREIDSMIQEEAFAGAADVQSAIKRLKALEREAAAVSVPLSYAGELYHLRLHIAFLQEKLEKLAGQPAERGQAAGS